MTNEQFDTHLWKQGQKFKLTNGLTRNIIAINFKFRRLGYGNKRSVTGIYWVGCEEVELIND
jgi:hypothetical protein